ncbi:MAG: type II secretion system protein [Erysipelotrichaceae bacterium]
MKNEKGFTLLELVVVIAIMGVLALIIVPNFSSVLFSSQEASARNTNRNAYTQAMTEWTKAEANSPNGITGTDLQLAIREDYEDVELVCQTNGSDRCLEVLCVRTTYLGQRVSYPEGR